uniref:ATP synthase F(0) complex subunit 8 n=3 Tax=Gorilla gorilla TaxID=9593 RepID=ATP8_GORGO|nr:ATP synthase F0 subunit 8 [Gorilla gorilla]Q34571.1 RecName: Full=ATP synthase protein 8; AltName: Full=A6L; AltName: Full=F-ATPase subunit 8 [Gorilla gorilla gorilla]ABV58889.1 ATPase subunit 8 [Gorilla gorilla]AHH93078.1 ATP synthase F0 subunit 8 [Gorilla gorilla gorilla]AMB65459.1 ATP synthase F0 subunit 8 [Gorilla gorilla gorilla]AMB65472.1 ATP synthase F0 subunit 8 [Gorilla gorilla gorilla]AMB65485.1 ATP synthase F0 subunit 8 [Gorilla gorilla gorilla]
MPQLNTTVWPTMIAPMLLTLFLITQLKVLNTNYHLPPLPKTMKMKNFCKPWEPKWTKIYSLHSLPPQS